MRFFKLAVLGAVLLLALPLAALAGDDPFEKKEADKAGGHVIFVRFLLGTEGMGIAQCGSCNTAAGCKSAWCQAGSALSCKATPAAGWKFTHWSANGNFAGDKPQISFCRKGADLKAHFSQAK